ncbi:Mitochondrial outer membrane protein porin 3 [Raphanus sativus]|nr:Mitochondrial outer membrane protein porin 3 [Raphanus sativus]
MNRASQYRSSLKLQIKVDDKTGSNLRCLLKTFGCGSAMASSSVTIKWVKVKAIKEILTIMNTSLFDGINTVFLNLLYKDYQGDQKLTITTYSSTGFAITTSGTNRGDLFVGSVATQVKNKNFTADIKVASDSSVELQYLHTHAGVSTSVGLTANPVVNFSSLIGTSVFALGTDNTVVRAQVNYNLKSQVDSITVGAQHSLDPLTTVKAPVNNAGIANALIQHEWRPKPFITICGEVDSRAIEKNAKVGFTIALKP